MYSIAIKSGSCGYSDYDNCDWVVAEVQSDNIPRVGDILDIDDGSNEGRKEYLVREIKRSINLKTDKHEEGEWIRVYVIHN